MATRKTMKRSFDDQPMRSASARRAGSIVCGVHPGSSLKVDAALFSAVAAAAPSRPFGVSCSGRYASGSSKKKRSISGASFRVRRRSRTSGTSGANASGLAPGMREASRAASSSVESRRMNWPLSQSRRSRFAIAGLGWIFSMENLAINSSTVRMSSVVPGDHPRKAMKLSTASGR